MPLGSQAKQLALIVDLDETLCTQINIAVEAGVEVLRRIDQLKIQVHYVTARTTISRDATLMFLGEHRLPGRENVHYETELRAWSISEDSIGCSAAGST